MRLPSVKKLFCNGFGSISGSYDWDSGSSVSNISCLNLVDCYLLVDDVVGMLKCFKGLRKLNMEWNAETVIAEDWVEAPGIDVSSILCAVLEHADTLGRLTMMDVTDGWRIFRSKAHILHDFKALRKLEVDGSVLVGYSS